MAGQVALLAALSEGVIDTVPHEAIPALQARVAAGLDAILPDGVRAAVADGVVDSAALTALVAAVRDLVGQVAPAPRAQP